MNAAKVDGRCASCTHFRNEPAFLEKAMPGMTSMGSAHASVRAEDGICLRHDRYLSARSTCAEYASVGTSVQFLERTKIVAVVM
jgi:hypothetical protein